MNRSWITDTLPVNGSGIIDILTMNSSEITDTLNMKSSTINQTQVLMLEQQALNPLSCLPHPVITLKTLKKVFKTIQYSLPLCFLMPVI